MSSSSPPRRPPFFLLEVGPSQQPIIKGGLLQNTSTFFEADVHPAQIFGGSLFQDADTFNDGLVTSNAGTIQGSIIGESIEVIDSVTSNDAVSRTNHTVDIPDGSHIPGRLVVVAVAAEDDPTFTFPMGWTELLDTSSTTIALGIGYRVIDETEGFDGSGDTITVSTSVSKVTSHISYLVKNFVSSEIEISSTATGMSTSPNPSEITPSDGYNNYLNIALEAHDSGVTTTDAYPTNYVNNQCISAGDLLNGCGIGGAHLIRANSSENPDTFTISQVRDWIAVTVSVKSDEVDAENEFFQGAVTTGFIEASLLQNTNVFNNGTIYVGTRISSGQIGLNVATEDPGPHTLDASRDWIAVTISILGA